MGWMLGWLKESMPFREFKDRQETMLCYDRCVLQGAVVVFSIMGLWVYAMHARRGMPHCTDCATLTSSGRLVEPTERPIGGGGGAGTACQ